MEYLIKNIKNNTYFFGCLDISAFNMPYYMAFGDENVAETFYSLQQAINRINFILAHDINIKAEELKIYIIGTNEELTIQQAQKQIKKTKSKAKKQAKEFVKKINSESNKYV